MRNHIARHEHSGRWSFGRFIPLTEIELKALASEGKTRISSLLLEPIVQLLLLVAGLQGIVANADNFVDDHSYLMFVLPGLFGLQALGGFNRTMYRTVLDRQWGMLSLKRLGGAGGAGYTASKVVAPTIALVVQISVMALVALLMGERFGAAKFVGTLLITVVSIVFWSALAIVITAFVRDYVVRDMIIKWLMLPMSLAAPVFYSLDSAPGYLQWIARFNPLAWQVQAIRDMLLEGHVGPSAAIMTMLAVIACMGATFSVSWGDALTSEGGR